MIVDTDRRYHADRAIDEAIRAIDGASDAVSAIHGELCLLHCSRVIAALIGGAARRR